MGHRKGDRVVRELQDHLLAQGAADKHLLSHHLGKKHHLISKGYALLDQQIQAKIQEGVEKRNQNFPDGGFSWDHTTAGRTETGTFVILILTSRAFHISSSVLLSGDIFSISLIFSSSIWSFTFSRHNSWDTGSGMWV